MLDDKGILDSFCINSFRFKMKHITVRGVINGWNSGKLVPCLQGAILVLILANN